MAYRFVGKIFDGVLIRHCVVAIAVVMIERAVASILNVDLLE